MGDEITKTDGDHHDDSGHGHHEKPRYDDINTGVIVLVGIISTIATIVTIAFVQGLTYHWEDNLKQKNSYEVVDTPAKFEVDRQTANLNYNPENGAISIEDAMKQVIDQFGKDDASTRVQPHDKNQADKTIPVSK